MDAEARATRGCPTSGGCRSRPAPRCSPTGVRSPLGIQIFGDDLETIERAAVDIERARGRDPGHAHRLRRPLDRRLLPRCQGRPRARPRGTAWPRRDVNAVVQTAIGGDGGSPRRSKAASAIRSPCATRASSGRTRRRSGRCWWRRPPAPRCRSRRWPISRFALGPPMIRSEDGKLVGYVFVDAASAPIADYVEEARRVVASEVEAAGGPAPRVGGAVHLLRARQAASSSVVLPVTLFSSSLLLYFEHASR